MHDTRETGWELPRSRDLDEAALRVLVARSEPLSLEPGQALFEKGTPGDGLYLVISGCLQAEGEEAALPLREGDLAGVVEALAGEPRTSTVRAVAPSRVLRVEKSALEGVLAERPDLTDELVEAAERLLLRLHLARLLPGFRSVAPEALADISRAFRWLRLPRGRWLYEQGDPADALYLLVSGRLQARVRGPDGPKSVREIVPGETVGEASLVRGSPRAATIVASRDSVLQVIDRDDFEGLVEAWPGLWRHICTLLARRVERSEGREPPAPAPVSVAIVPLHPDVGVGDLAGAFGRALGHTRDVLVLDRPGMETRLGLALPALADDRLRSLRLLPWFEDQEARHDVVVYVAESALTPWTIRCLAQAERILLVADADADPLPGTLEDRIDDLLADSRPPVHLVLVHPSDRDRPRDTARWLEPRDAHRHHHVRRGREEDLARVARLVTGNGLGLVLSGGGARAFAHIGVLAVLDELGVSVDAVGGTSAGAGLGSQYAMGHTPAEIRDINWREFARKKPFSRYTLPVYSLVGREGVDRACHSIYGDFDIADLWIPFFCTSSDLHTGKKVMHLRGPLWKAARASTSLPGIVPPVVDGPRLLVDGGVLDNVPEEEMARFCEGRVIAVEVTPGQPVHPGFDYDAMPSPWRVLWRRVNPFARPYRIPRLVEILMRTGTMANLGQAGRVDDVAELVLRPPVSRYGMLDFPAIDSIIADAIPYSRETLGRWLREEGERRVEGSPARRTFP